ncbi:APC family permease [Pseudonocardia endophytica]|uniref:Amino acid/polyamine/organocation transporter (APC superfamily) n=1 Tax=Pseudonocardia endophytica TaxID=401976 RepID=A0A4R1I1R6_PSEEN|nr:APC family permease [Pseudonocardia endophytica]TCK26399.1 amino acid/polyamine/organocation transporter (APC superfamily) [Pseudonocardia endophytica]
MSDDVRPGLRRRSPVHGLARRQLGPLEVLAQSVSGAAPSAAMAAVPAIVAASAGGGTVWSFVIATALALLIAGCIARFTRRMAAPGGLYSLTAKGLNPAAAYASAVGMVTGYGLLAAGTLAGFTIYVEALLGGLGLGFDVLTVVVAGAVTGVFVLRGARLSARVVLLVESVSIGLMLVVFTLLLATTPASPAPSAPASVTGVAVGVLPALTAFIGFEIATALGAEARRPFRSVPRAVGITAAGTGVLYLFAAQVQVVGFSATPGGLAGSVEPVVTLAERGGWSWIPTVLDAGLAASFFAGCLAASTALVRVLFSLARDEVVPAPLGRTHPVHRTPHVAVAVALPVVTAVPAVMLAVGVSPTTALMALVTLAACGFLLAYVLVCAAAPAFLRRIGELTWPAVAVSVVLVPILIAVLVVFVAGSPWSVPVLGALLLAGVAGYVTLRVRRPAALAAIGVYDETTADDVLTDRSGPT